MTALRFPLVLPDGQVANLPHWRGGEGMGRRHAPALRTDEIMALLLDPPGKQEQNAGLKDRER
jgi:hypothetical protein